MEAADKPSRSFLSWPVHCFVLAVFPIASLYARSFDEVAAGDVLLPLVVSLAATSVLLVGIRLARGCWQRAALATSLVLAMFFFFQFGHRGIFIAARLLGAPELSYGTYFVLWSVLLVAGLATLFFFPRQTQNATRALNLFALILLAIGIGTSAGPIWRTTSARREAAKSTELEPLELTSSSTSSDIYYLVFDRYAGQSTLEEQFGFDNQAFLAKLEERGFFCAPDAHANYPRTKISMASALNMRLLADPIQENHVSLIAKNRVAEELRENGYRYYHFGNWYGPLRRNPQADVNWRVSSYPSYFTEELCRTTPLLPLFQLFKGETPSQRLTLSSPDQINEKFVKVGEVSSESGKKFVYAHFLLPHPPFLFNADGTLATGEQLASRTPEESYLEQLEYTNSRIIELVDKILANSTSPPIIVIQADEGPVLLPSDQQKSRREKISKRAGIISCYHLPGRDAPALIGDHPTPVNTFRVVFSEYFGAELEPLPNEVFYWQHPDAEGMPDRTQAAEVVNVTREVSSHEQNIDLMDASGALP